MLDSEDVKLVEAYIYADFPELEGRVAFRRFDPPSLPKSEHPFDLMGRRFKNADYRRLLDGHEERVRHDLFDQTPSRLHTSMKRSFDDAVQSGLWGLISRGRRYEFLESCLNPYPLMLAVLDTAKIPRRYGVYPDHFYITQAPSDLTAEHVYEWFIGKKPEQSLPDNFLRVFKIITTAHEFGHVVKANYFEAPHKQECVSDILSFDAALSIVGDSAIPTLDIFAGARKTEGAADIHQTGDLLESAMRYREYGFGNLGAREAIRYAMDSYQFHNSY